MTYTMVTVQTGAELEVELLDPIRPGNLRPGDALKFGVTRPLIENNMILVPLNSLINGEITAVEAAAGGEEGGQGGEAGGDGEHVMVKVRFVDVFFNGEAWPISASVVEIVPGPGAAAGAEARMNLGPGVRASEHRRMTSTPACAPVKRRFSDTRVREGIPRSAEPWRGRANDRT